MAWIHNFKYLRSRTLDFKDIGIRKSEFQKTFYHIFLQKRIEYMVNDPPGNLFLSINNYIEKSGNIEICTCN